MKYITVAEASKKWGLTPRSVQLHCLKGNVHGATLQGKSWRIPIGAVRPLRKPRAGKMPTSVLVALKAEKRGRLSGGLYHRLQIDFTYNSNRIEGSRLTHEQTRWIFETKTIGNLPTESHRLLFRTLCGDSIILAFASLAMISWQEGRARSECSEAYAFYSAR